MRKRVLMVEESDTFRKVAESFLRQNGFEVISVTTSDKALEVLNLSSPDLIIVGSEITGKGKKPMYEYLQEIPKYSAIPLLIISNPEETGLPFPEEVIIPRPFEPKEFIVKVNAFVGQRSPKNKAQAALSNPLDDADLEDEFLDAALGLDRIDVTDSEVMDKTSITSLHKKNKISEKMIGFDHQEKDTETTDSGKVESLMIQDENAEINPNQSQKNLLKALSASGKIEILNDQFGIVDSEVLDEMDKNSAHDYDWFVKEMQKDGKPKDASSKPAASKNNAAQDSEMKISSPSSFVDPITQPPKSAKKNSTKSQSPKVDKFINEFKKEIEKIQTSEPESVTIEAKKQPSTQPDNNMVWEDTIEKITPEAIGIFTQNFISELAEKIAEKIAHKLDSEKLLNLLKHEIIASIKKNQKNKTNS